MYIRDYNKTTRLYDTDAFVVDGSQETLYILVSDLYESLIGNKGFVTESWIINKGYQTAEQVETRITNKGYQTAKQVETIINGKGYKTETEIRNIITGYSYTTANDVNSIINGKSFATQSWVQDQGYQTAEQVNTIINGKGYATQNWVESKNYLTSAALNGYATESWVESKGYLVSDSLTGYATEDWVESKNYLTSAALNGYATELWVQDQNYQNESQVIALIGEHGGSGGTIDPENLNELLETHGPSDAAQTVAADHGLPFAGTPVPESVADVNSWIKTVRSGFYSINTQANGWQHMVINKHRNGYSDGSNYVLYITSRLTTPGNLIWNKMVSNSWQGERTILDSSNYSDQIAAINNRLTLTHGSYVHEAVGSSGTAGLVNFMRIKIIGTYANYPLCFLLSGRGRNLPMMVSVHFISANSTDPGLSVFYKTLLDTYDVYIYRTGTSQWDLYAPKNEAYGRIDILDLWYSKAHFEITYPNTHVASVNSAWTKAVTAGVVNVSNCMRDNSRLMYSCYHKTSMIPGEFSKIACWNIVDDYTAELRETNLANFLQAKMANSYYGMCVGAYTDNQWVRTTSQGLLPYQSGTRSSGHCYLGTDSWFFLRSYVTHMHGHDVEIDNTYNTSASTGTYLAGAKGENVGINMTAAAGFNIIAKVKSTNGRFILGCYNGDFQLYYIADSLVSASNNSYTWGITLMNESGNMKPTKSEYQCIGDTNAYFRYVYTNNVGIAGGLNCKYSSNAYIGFESGGNVVKITSLNAINLLSNSTSGVTLGAYVGDNSIRRTISYKGVSSDNVNAYFMPSVDGTSSLGRSSYRWNEIYCKTPTISTSDRREKKNISYMGLHSDEITYMSDDTLQAFIRGLLPCIYLRIDGDSGRPHHGLISQDVEELLKKLGIKDHAGFIKSPIEEDYEVEEPQEVEYESDEMEEYYEEQEVEYEEGVMEKYETEEEIEVIDEETGAVTTKVITVEKERMIPVKKTGIEKIKKTRPIIKTRIEMVKVTKHRIVEGEYRYGLRLEEFMGDVIRFVQIKDQEIQNQQEIINDLMDRVKRLETLITGL